MSDLVKRLRSGAKRLRDNARHNNLSHRYVVYIQDEAADRIEELGSALESRLSEISRLQATLYRIRSCQRYEISELDSDLVPTKKGIWMLADDVLGVLGDE